MEMGGSFWGWVGLGWCMFLYNNCRVFFVVIFFGGVSE